MQNLLENKALLVKSCEQGQGNENKVLLVKACEQGQGKCKTGE